MTNSATVQEIQEALGLSLATDKLPNAIPVVEVNPKMVRRALYNDSQLATNAATQNFNSLPSDKDFYLTNASLTCCKDATSTGTAGSLQVQLAGGAANQTIIAIRTLASTANSQTVCQNFNPPLKLERGSTPRISSSASANMSTGATIQGYFDEVKD